MPAALCDGICSLKENVTRIALTMDIFVAGGVTVKTEYCNAFIKVRKNYCYEEASLLKDPHYCDLLHTVKGLSVKGLSTNDSHELVSSLMILMNHSCACELAKNGSKGIFRKTVPIESAVPDLGLFPFAGNYVVFSDSLGHEALGLNAYVHITSPIRRMVDLLNSIVFQPLVMGFHELSSEASAFYDKWAAQLDYINVSTREIRKVQSDCELLHLCNTTPNLLTTIFEGYILELVERKGINANNNSNYSLLCYSVYLPKLKLFSQTYVPNDFVLTNPTSLQKFQLFLFQDEERFRKKIRVQLL